MKRRKKKAPVVNVSGEPPTPSLGWEEGDSETVTPKPEPSHPKARIPRGIDSEPMAPGRKLRTIKLDDFPPIASEKVTLVLFTTLYEPRFALSPRAKVELLDGVVEDPKGRLVAIWTGSRQSHAFDVTDEIAAEWLASMS